MLTISTGQGVTRREVLRIGSLAAGGLMLPAISAGNGLAAETGAPVTDKSVVFLFMKGGPSQFETFDPKMDAPAEIRSQTGEVQTTVPGLTFGGTFTNLAKHAKRLAVVRSYHTNTGHGSLEPLVSTHMLGANIGAVYSRVAGTNHPQTGMPITAAAYPDAVDEEFKGRGRSFGKLENGGTLGPAYAPFVPGAGGQFQQNLTLNLPQIRFADRRSLLSQIDKTRRWMDSADALDGADGIKQRAFDVILNGVGQAFDLSKEDPRTIARYDTSEYCEPELWAHKNNRNNYKAHATTLGKLLLMSRRLCEAGCRFVSLTTDFVWDMHQDKNNLGVAEGMHLVGRPFDHAVSAFIEDVEARGLSDKILLVCVGEMGRTPRLSKTGGRGHWGALAPLLLYGGGITHGQVVGQSDRGGGKPATSPLGHINLLSTITNTLYDVGELRIQRQVPNNVRQAIERAGDAPGVV